MRYALVALLIASLGASQIPRWAFAFDPDTCCCHHAGKCPCPEHQLPKHDGSPVARSCGSGGHYLAETPIPVFDVPPAAVAEVVAAAPFTHAAPPAPRAAPTLEAPSAPS